MTFGEPIRQLRNAKGLSLRQLAPKVGVGFTCLSRVETGNITFGDYPSGDLIHRLADELTGDEEDLLILAERIPSRSTDEFYNGPTPLVHLPSATTKL